MKEELTSRLDKLTPEERDILLQELSPTAQALLIKAFPEAVGLLTGMARGGLIKGPGGGLDDLVQGSIEGKKAARLSNGEFVVPADAVRAMGRGSTRKGAEGLARMTQMVRKKAGLKPKPMHNVGLRGI